MFFQGENLLKNKTFFKPSVNVFIFITHRKAYILCKKTANVVAINQKICFKVKAIVYKRTVNIRSKNEMRQIIKAWHSNNYKIFLRKKKNK